MCHERFALDGQAVGLTGQAAQLVLQLFDTRPFHLRCLVRGALFAVETFPALLPVTERRFGRGQAFVERAFGSLRLRQLRAQLFDLGAQRFDLAPVALDVRVELGQRGTRLGQLVALLVA